MVVHVHKNKKNRKLIVVQQCTIVKSIPIALERKEKENKVIIKTHKSTALAVKIKHKQETPLATKVHYNEGSSQYEGNRKKKSEKVT